MDGCLYQTDDQAGRTDAFFFSEWMTKPLKRMDVCTERMIKPFERMQFVSDWITKPFERMDVSTERMSKLFERMQIFLNG